MRQRPTLFTQLLLLLLAILCSAISVSTVNAQLSPKGRWGRVTPIPDNKHPNLFYNQSEIDELRNMILVQQQPQRLVDIYNTYMRGAIADGADWYAAIGYMIEPSSAKADAIRRSLIEYMNSHPAGLEDWASAQCFCGYPLAFMFDLIQAYHPEKLSSREKNDLKAWFAKSAQALKVNSTDPRALSQSGLDQPPPPQTREGKTVDSIPNWYTRYMGPSLAAALVSGDQAAVDYWADSGWPHGLFTFEGVTETYPDATANRYDMVTSLLAVFPSGANIETYERESWRYGGSESDWYTTNYYDVPKDGGSYHFAQIQGPIMGAIMAYHNGMNGVFGLTDVPGTEPAILRTFKRAIGSRSEIDRRADSLTGHPSIGYEPFISIAQRFYSDPEIEAAIPALDLDLESGADFWDIPYPFAFFLGYPKRVAWTAESTACELSGSCESAPASSAESLNVPFGSSKVPSISACNEENPPLGMPRDSACAK